MPVVSTRLTPTESKGKCCLADVFLGRRGRESDANGRARERVDRVDTMTLCFSMTLVATVICVCVSQPVCLIQEQADCLCHSPSGSCSVLTLKGTVSSTISSLVRRHTCHKDGTPWQMSHVKRQSPSKTGTVEIHLVTQTTSSLSPVE